MSEVDVCSPPYPGEHTIPGVLFEHLLTLHTWIISERGKLGDVREVVPKVASTLVNKAAFEQQPIAFLWRSLIHLRRIRESWDHLLRVYEADWEAPICVRARALILQQAVILLNSTRLSPETREAQSRREVERLHAVYVHLSRELLDPLQPATYDNGTSFDHDG